VLEEAALPHIHRPAIASIFFGAEVSKTLKFSSMRSLRTDFGMATTPRWVSHRKMI
jgi:hypothetical protein